MTIDKELVAELESLRAENELLKQVEANVTELHNIALVENETLRARLAEVEAQEPVAWRARVHHGQNFIPDGYAWHYASHQSTYHDCEQYPLYAAPVVSPDVEKLKAEIADLQVFCDHLNDRRNSLVVENMSLKTELREISEAIDDPAINLTQTAVECINDLKLRIRLAEGCVARNQETNHTCMTNISDLRKELEAARKDAGRYRWLRWTGDSEIYLHNQPGVDNCAQLGCECLDAIIDAAIEQAKGGVK